MSSGRPHGSPALLKHLMLNLTGALPTIALAAPGQERRFRQEHPVRADRRASGNSIPSPLWPDAAFQILSANGDPSALAGPRLTSSFGSPGNLRVVRDAVFFT
jgi:hypothetical protein